MGGAAGGGETDRRVGARDVARVRGRRARVARRDDGARRDVLRVSERAGDVYGGDVTGVGI